MRQFPVPFLALLLVFFSATGQMAAQTVGPSPAALVVNVTPRVVETDQRVSWEQPLTKEVAPGTPVVVNINAEGLAIRVTVTPFVREKDFLVVVQGDVRQSKATSGRQSSSVQSLLVPPGAPIVFFPLGRDTDGLDRQMVVLIRVDFRGE